MTDCLENVAILGAGLGADKGCALALALFAHNVRITVYEARPPTSQTFASGVILTPNGLRILDRLGVLPRIKDRCYISTYRTFKNDRDETVRKTLIADQGLYGYTNHRVWRTILLDEMRQMLVERSVAVRYNSKFNGIVSDAADGVVFRINDTSHSASLLVGADGIYSAVRKHLAPDVGPEYTGIVGILSHIKRASVDWPYEDYERNATIQGKPGAIFFIPEDPQAEDIMVGLQVQYPSLSRGDLDELQADKDKLVAFYRKDYDEWGPTAKSIIDSVEENKETCYIWPYLRMPKLPQWYSDTGRVVIVGDGAHAVPPSSGQGVNQALEDVYSLTMLLVSVAGKPCSAAEEPSNTDKRTISPKDPGRTRLLEALSFWQDMRQKRIDAVYDWAMNATNVQRLPETERKKLIAEGKINDGKAGEGDNMRWLYRPNLEEEVKVWIDRKAASLYSAVRSGRS
ncbi:hypothetical protein LTR85_009957 [Meristemomyces frigidus]|nr:hypothetical protein LTR85_009957 [Meristemomyces frigidus]